MYVQLVSIWGLPPRLLLDTHSPLEIPGYTPGTAMPGTNVLYYDQREYIYR